jgi:hypothetical protein
MDNWIPEGLRDAPYFKADSEGNFRSMDQVRADLDNAAAWQGNSLRIPGPDASDEQKTEFMGKAVERIPGLMPVPIGEDVGELIYQKIGKPTEAEKYKFPEIEDSPFADETIGTMKARAFENNLTQTQFTKLVNDQLAVLQDSRAADDTMITQEQAVLQEEWGSAKDERMTDIANFLSNDESAPPELAQAVKDGKVTAQYARWLYNLVERVSEPGELNGQPRGEPTPTPAEAKARLNEINAQIIGMPETDPSYQHLYDQRLELAKAAFG